MGSEVSMILGEMCVFIIDLYLCSCIRFCVVHCLIIICLYLLFPNYLICFFNILFMFVFLFSILCILCFCIVSPFVYSCFFPIFVQVYRPLPPIGNPFAVNKYHIVYLTRHPSTLEPVL
jgi:hypothetical protein